MADTDGVVVNVEDDYDFDDPSRNIGEILRRLRLCFRDSDFAKVESVLIARENKMKEEIRACERGNQRLNIKLKNLERDKREADSEVERWMTKYRLLESRILKLEADVGMLKSGDPGVRVSGENGVNVEMENEVLDVNAIDLEGYVDSAAAQNVGLAGEGNGRTPTRNIVEIIDSDDEFTPGGNLSGRLTFQRVANTAHLNQTGLQKGTEMLKRKHDSNLSVGENDNNDGTIIGNALAGDCNINKLQKVIHVCDGSPNNRGSATDNNVETNLTPSSHFSMTLRQCEEKMGTENATQNLMSGFLSNVCGGCDNDDSSSSSSDSDDDVNTNFDISQLRQQDDKKWEYEIDTFLALGKDDELCLKAVCALYRQQISLGTSSTNLSSSKHRGFNDLNVLRGTTLAKFLVDGDPQGRLKKSVSELLQFDQRGLDDCKRISINHSKQLFDIYKKKEDPLFLP